MRTSRTGQTNCYAGYGMGLEAMWGRMGDSAYCEV